MGEGRKQRGAKPEGATEEKQPEKTKGAPNRAKNKKELVRSVLQQIEAKLAADKLKPTVGDFIRLVQLDKELAEEQPREIKVSWVEPDKKENAPEK